MPLSDEERTQLEALEQELGAEDPRLAQKLLSGSLQPAFTVRTLLGFLTSLVGLLLLLVGIALHLIVLGVGGFLLMVAGGCWAIGQAPRIYWAL